MREIHTIVEAGRTEKQYWQDIWHYRALLCILSWRDVQVRYKQTALGVAWSILRPLLIMGVFTLVFGRIAGFPSEGNAPYALLVYAALLPWQFFSSALSEAGSSLLGNSNLITKVYFPRIFIPAGSVMTALADFATACVLLCVLLPIFRFTPSWHLIFLPFFVLLVAFAALGAGLLFAALNVRYRDFRYIIPFIVQFGLYVSPVGFSSALAPESWRWVYYLNPMVGIIEGFRWCILGAPALNPHSLLSSITTTAALLWLGIAYFRKMEKNFADEI